MKKNLENVLKYWKDEQKKIEEAKNKLLDELYYIEKREDKVKRNIINILERKK